MQAGNITILPDPGNPANSYTQLYAANNQYAAPIKFLLSGFEAGFWGGQALSIPDAVAGNTGAAHLDLNKSWNWSGLYAYRGGRHRQRRDRQLRLSEHDLERPRRPLCRAGLQDQQRLRLVLFGFHRLAGRRHQSDPQPVDRHGRRRHLDQALRPDRHAHGLHAHGAQLHVPGTPSGATMAPSTGANQFIINTMVGIPGSTQNVAPVDGTPMTLPLLFWRSAGLGDRAAFGLRPEPSR